MVRVVRPPPVACRRLDSLDGSSGVASQYGLDAVHDLPEEAVVVNWLLAGGGADMMDIVFCIGSRVARWDDMLTLVLGSLAWVARVGWFREWMAVDFESSPYKDYSEVDMGCCRVLRYCYVAGKRERSPKQPPLLLCLTGGRTSKRLAEEHYFLICFDFRCFRLEIIDNSASPKGKNDIYGDSLEDMQDMLQEFFAKTHPGKSVLAAGLEPKRMQMPWRGVRNKIDCGIYLMRHMETFTGQSFKHWDCGLVKEHYFLICFDFRCFRLEIIDNSASPKGKNDIYGDSLEDMQDMLQEFFAKTHPGKSVLAAGLEPKRMQMPWRGVRNKIDCGIYLMRHMETFTGQSFKHWDCGLVKGDFTMLHKLRLQYMKNLVLSEYNLYMSQSMIQ
nr:zinc finger BED domain-containing protein RICESLEEPER 2-like [Ipomoea batatas]